MLDRGVRRQIERYGVENLFRPYRKVFRKADATVINLECPLTSKQTPINKRFIFRADPVWAEGLRQSGITHAAMANNHTNDQGRAGLVDTYQNLVKAGITPLGYGTTFRQQGEPVFISKGNIKAALFNAVTFPLENWHPVDGRPGICQSTPSQMTKIVSDFKEKHPECFIIVILHWGVEYMESPTLSQRKEAFQLFNAGADAIIGHHPHVLQSVERIGGKVVAYSLGNFIFDNPKPKTKEKMMIRLLLTDHHRMLVEEIR